MNTTDSPASAFVWDAGGWYGAQIGCTLWLLILGIVILPKDGLAATTCIGSFAVLNAWGVFLLRRRAHLDAYSGIQRFLAAASVIIVLVVVAVNGRGLSEQPLPAAGVSTHLPYWAIGMAPVLMLFFYLRQRATWGNSR